MERTSKLEVAIFIIMQLNSQAQNHQSLAIGKKRPSEATKKESASKKPKLG